MCGILGISSKSIIDKKICYKSIQTLNHRGPNDKGIWFSSSSRSVCFAHARLSIIDLTNQSKQPMIDSSGNYVLIFNGEIYNFQSIKKYLSGQGIDFKTTGDTEVLLEAFKFWGENCINKLVGMFSFAIYDIKSEKIFIARDRSGEKPLFYFYDGQDFIFGSELKALLSFPQIEKKINLKSLKLLLAQGYIHFDNCIVKNVKKLPAGHYLSFDIKSQNLAINKYWDLPKPKYNSNSSNADLVNKLEFLLEKSLKKQLIADVPVGVLLSGGLDSSIITALSSKINKKINTFTINFPNNPTYDESSHARLISNYFGTNHYELDAENFSIELLPKLAKQYDEPIIDSSALPTYLVTKLVREKCTVALGGDGGDELFGGYDHYSRLLFLEKNLKFVNHKIRKKISSSILKVYKKQKGRNWISAFGCNFESELPRIATYFYENEIKKLIHNEKLNEFSSDQEWNNITPSTKNLLERATRMDFYNYLCEDILVKVDRASMLNSLEMRAPMLDHEIIEFAFEQIPPHLKSTSNEKKILLKMLGKKILPREFKFSRKMGLNAPINDWFKTSELTNFFREILLDNSQKFFDHTFVEKLIVEHLKGNVQGERLYGLLMFQLWVNEYKMEY